VRINPRGEAKMKIPMLAAQVPMFAKIAEVGQPPDEDRPKSQ
jgi:hypothetical protein